MHNCMVHAGSPSHYSGARKVSNGNPTSALAPYGHGEESFLSCPWNNRCDWCQFDGKTIYLAFFLNITKRCAHPSGPAKPKKLSA